MSDAPPRLAREACRYQAYYCEENVWQLCQDSSLGSLGSLGPLGRVERFALFVTNPARACPLWHQRAGHPVVWDYHVVLLTRPDPRIWDLDTTLAFPCPATDWLDATFCGLAAVPRAMHPRFRLVPAATLTEHFASDRRHMRGPHGEWLQPPPPWPPIVSASGESHTLERFLDLTQRIGDDDAVIDLTELRALLGE